MDTSRYDGFIIWGHGIKHVNEIMTVLRSRFDVIIILRKDISDVRAFVDQVYAIDSYPIDIIQEKTEYLLNEKKEAVFVLVRNNHVNVWNVDMGKYAKTECRYIAETKVIIRKRYNTVLNHHVIHGTDNESETRHILSLFTDLPIEYYISGEGTPFPFHIAPFEYEEVDVNITELKGSLYDDLWGRQIASTPHYLYATGNKIPYKEYYEKHYGHELIEDHFPDRFDDMINFYNNGGKFPPILVIKDRIIDGGHRCAIYLANNKVIVKAYRRKEVVNNVKPPKKRILLIGGTGAVGQSLLGAFDEEKYEVRAIGSAFLDITDKNADYDKLGNPEVVVNLAGINDTHLLSEFSYGTDNLIDVNCIGNVNLLAGIIPLLTPYKYGRIILISSIFSEINEMSCGVYSASKAFIDKLVKIAALENAKNGITVNSIQLGYTGVGMNEVFDKIAYEKSKNKCALNRFCSPTDIVKTIAYMIETEYLTGQNIRLDGGIR